MVDEKNKSTSAAGSSGEQIKISVSSADVVWKTVEFSPADVAKIFAQIDRTRLNFRLMQERAKSDNICYG